MRLIERFRNTRHFSVLIVPDGDNRTFGFRVHSFTCILIAFMGILIVSGVVFGVITYWKVSHLALQADRLKKENDFLLRENAKVLQLQQSLYEMKEIDYRLRVMAGMEEETAGQTSEENTASKGNGIQHMARWVNDYGYGGMESDQYADGGTHVSSVLSEPSLQARPSLWPVQGWVTAEFGFNVGPLGGKHTGIDIAAPSDTPVKASADGVVTFVGWTEKLGNLIMIQHNSVFSTRYGHNSRVLVGQGEWVRRGQTIAFIGSSGRSSAPHLHFEIWKDGHPVNPREYLMR